MRTNIGLNMQSAIEDIFKMRSRLCILVRVLKTSPKLKVTHKAVHEPTTRIHWGNHRSVMPLITLTAKET